MGEGWASLGTLLAGMAVWGGAGWLVDTWLGISVFLPVGVLVGLAASVYLVYASSARSAQPAQASGDRGREGGEAG